MATPQSQAVNIANSQISLVRALAVLRDQITPVVDQAITLSLATVWAALPTAPTNPDGSLGVTDAKSVAGNVVDVSVVTGLERAITGADMLAMNSFLVAVRDFLSGQTVPAQAQAEILMAKVVGG